MTRLSVAVSAVVVVALLWPAPAAAGEERYKWWYSDRVRAEIGLSDAQARDIEAIFQSVVPTLRSQKAELDRLEHVVSSLLAEGNADESKVSQAIERAEAQRGATNRTRMLMLFRMYRVLTPEQRVKLSAWHERSEQEKKGSKDGAGLP
jgi:Spy/CpxP family protein refolding chaperone